MLKQTVTYTDYNDEQQTEDLYFNLTKTEVAENLFDLLPRIEAFAKATDGPLRELSNDEVKEMLDIVKVLIKASYGERSPDGKYFRKSEQIYTDFTQSAVYDKFVFDMFEDVEKANNFMIGIMPKDLRESEEVQAAVNGRPVQTVKTGGELNAVQEEVPAYIRENREPTQQELAAMSPKELQEAFRRKVARQ